MKQIRLNALLIIRVKERELFHKTMADHAYVFEYEKVSKTTGKIYRKVLEDLGVTQK